MCEWCAAFAIADTIGSSDSVFKYGTDVCSAGSLGLLPLHFRRVNIIVIPTNSFDSSVATVCIFLSLC